MKRSAALGCVLFTLSNACERSKPPPEASADAGTSALAGSARATPPEAALQLLYVPDGGDVALEGTRPPAVDFLHPSGTRCPPEMVDVHGRFCIDRYEAALVDARLGRTLSPYYAARRYDVRFALAAFENTAPPGAPALPRPPAWQLSEDFTPRATSRERITPNGYVSGLLARQACSLAGKRLCSPAEWVTACRGQQARKFPYGDRYEPGLCNVGREAHPAQVLYGNASKHHLDPRLNLVSGSEGPLLRSTGATPACRSEWGVDAVFDMVGNLDEWVDDPAGAFLGGFYARATQNGCEARVSEHPPEYFDYSTGVRCCL